MKPCNPLIRKIVGMFVRVLDACSQEDLEAFKQLLEVISEAKREENSTVAEKCLKILFPHFNLRIPHLKKHIKSIGY